ncbi:hypothetical protein B0H14DRAFT_3169237 [Mycena olivaceomarginata]|nr:hypothetical protein B0H14DRAFT_3169237 [Mycena olivaceomarginata]
MAEEIFAVFTEDQAATQAIFCQRQECGRQIQPNDPRFNIRNQNVNGKSKTVCRRPTKSRDPANEQDVENIRRQVIDARKKGSSQFNHSLMPPPPVPGTNGYPRVAIPSSWSGYTSYPMPGSQWNEPPGYRHANGYSDAHSQYNVHRAAWAQHAYQGNPAETIGIIMQVLRDVPGKTKGIVVENLTEGKEIPASSTPSYLIDLVLNTMQPKLSEATHGFDFGRSRPVIRDVVRWINLADESPNTPWFYERCLVTSSSKSKDKGRIFKRPKTSFAVALVLSAGQWEEYLAYHASIDLDENPTGRLSTSIWTGRARSEDTISTSSSAQIDVALCQQTHERGTTDRRQMDVGTVLLLKKRGRSESVYISPDRTRLRKVLAVNGATDISRAYNMHTSERIEFYPLHQCLLQELLGSEEAPGTQFFACDPANALQGSIVVEFTTDIGMGTFKTAHTGHLSLIHLPEQGLGITLNQFLAVKRMYRSPKNTGTSSNRAVVRFAPADEYAQTVQEANLLYWAASLMEFTYSFIHRFLSKSSADPPFEIPQLRFVHAGVAVSHDQAIGTNISNTTSIRRTYLVEEFINESSEGFVKFVHNGDANPLLDLDDPLYEIAEFLCFTQHVQYFKTDGTVFLSDLQGSASLLTDPQIMTSPKIADGRDIFGAGNVGNVFEKFPEQHICNTYCKCSFFSPKRSYLPLFRGPDQPARQAISHHITGNRAYQRGAPGFHTDPTGQGNNQEPNLTGRQVSVSGSEETNYWMSADLR